MRSTPLLALLSALLTVAAPARAAVWRRPVEGPVARAFAYGPNPFRRGWHRGVDLAAAPGAVVRAACSGTVVTARAVAGAGGVVTLLCHRWRVTHLPLDAIAVRRGLRVRAGTRLGVLASSRVHAGLHLGVRRAGDPFGYVNPMRFLPGGHPPAPPPPFVTAGGEPHLGPAPPPAAAPAARPVRAEPPHTAKARSAAPPAADARPAVAAAAPLAARPQAATPAGAARTLAASRGRVRALAPWPAWAGLALLLSGAIAGGVRARGRRRRAAVGLGATKGVP
jgi:hypothetical protein